MPELVLKKTGKPVYVPDERVADAIRSGMFEAPSADTQINVTMPGALGQAGTTTVGELERTQQAGSQIESEQAYRGREREARLDREHGGIIDQGITAVEEGFDTVTGGGFGILADAVGGEEYRERRLERREANPVAATVGKVAGVVGTLPASGSGALAKLARATPLGKVQQVGARIAKGGKGGYTRAAAGGAFEGAATGVGEAIQELNNSDEPLTWERVTSVVSSRVLLGAGVGAGANLATKGVEHALTKAKTALDDVARRAAPDAPAVADDLTGLDAKQLRTAREVEIEAIEASRVPQRQQLADELASFRSELKEQKLWLATKGAEEREIREIGKQSLKADRVLDRVLDNPKALAEAPQRAKTALQQQEHALEQLVRQADNLRVKFAGDTSGTRLAALDAAPAALERNRALQARIAELTSPASSARLTAIDDAKDALVTGGAAKKGMAEQMAGGAAYGMGASAVGAIPVVGPFLAPFAGAKAANFVTEKLFGQLGKATNAAAERMAKAVGTFLDVTKRAAPAAPVLATKTLSAVAYAPKSGPAEAPKKKAALADLYRARSEEVRSQVGPGPDGKSVMRRDARERMADQLAPIRMVAPRVADRMETQAARRIAFLADKLPRRPDIGGLPIGPDRWQPSDIEMRTWARYAAAVEDPAGIVERLGAGMVTPEDAEVMRELYPEILADITKQILEQLPSLQKSLPYERRLALSIMTGVAVDPAMDPRVLAILQGTFAAEEGSEGGMQAPAAQPQFGSVSKPALTPAQQRQQGAGA